ncbi:MAG TPA: radical SAM protein [Anaerolineales bacterium]|nr:radical SAM protein [Anaerolineales bacterium]
MAESGSSRSGFMPSRVIHLHPSRFCNLTCQHCYSSSGPGVRGELAAETIISALPALKAEGYEVLSLSGGEPLLYSGFKVVVHSAASLGFRINLVTNGAPVGGHLLDFIADYVNLVAVSLDGAPETHIDLRGDARAFLRAERAMDRLATVGVKFGIAYCISRESLQDMPWAVEFAKAKGAGLIQFHPFAPVGRGQLLANRLGLSESDRARAYIIAALLDTGQGLTIQMDLAPVEVARARRGDYAVLDLEDANEMHLSDLVNPLIIDETGLVSPLCYGINQRHALGLLGSNSATLVDHFKKEGWRDLRTLLDVAFARLGTCGENFVDWFYHIVETSYGLPAHYDRTLAPDPYTLRTGEQMKLPSSGS